MKKTRTSQTTSLPIDTLIGLRLETKRGPMSSQVHRQFHDIRGKLHRIYLDLHGNYLSLHQLRAKSPECLLMSVHGLRKGFERDSFLSQFRTLFTASVSLRELCRHGGRVPRHHWTSDEDPWKPPSVRLARQFGIPSIVIRYRRTR